MRSSSQLSGGGTRRSRQNSFKVAPDANPAHRYVEHRAAKELVERKTNAFMLVGLVAILLSLVATAVGAMHIKGFIEHTTEVLNPPPGTPAYEAQRQFDDKMPKQAEVAYFNVFITSRKSPILAVPTLCDYLNSVQRQLQSNPKTKHHYVHIGNYCFLKNMDMWKIADHLISPTNDSVTAPIIANVSRFEPAARTFGEGVQEIVDRTWPTLLNNTAFVHAENYSTRLSNETRKYFPLSSLPVTEGDFTIGVNGLSVFLASIAATSKRDLTMALAVVMPVVLVLVLLRLRGSLTLTLAVVYAAGGHFCASLGAMRPIANDMNVSAPTPLLMFCLGIGLSLCFSMLIVTEFVRGVRAYYVPLFDAFAAGVAPNEWEQMLLDREMIRRHRTRLSPSKRRRFDAKRRRELALKRADEQAPPPVATAAAAAQGDRIHDGDEDSEQQEENEVIFDEPLFHENLDHARCDVMVNVVMNSCGSISVAALAVMCSSVCIIFFPASIIQSLGVGCCMTVLAAWFFSVPVLISIMWCGFPFLASCCFCSSTWWRLESFLLPKRLKTCACGGGERGSEEEEMDDGDCLQDCMDRCGESSSEEDSDDPDSDMGDDEFAFYQKQQKQQQRQDSSYGTNEQRLQSSSAAAPASSSENVPLLNNGSGSFAESPQQQLLDQKMALREPIVVRKLSRCHAATYWIRFALVLASLGLLAWVATKIRLSNSYSAYLGRDAQATKNYLLFTEQYSYGLTSPFRILMAMNKKGLERKTNYTVDLLNKSLYMGVFDDMFWRQSQAIVERVLKDPVLGGQVHMAGPIVVGPHLTNGKEIFRCLITMDPALKWLQPWLCPDESITAFTMGQVNLETRNAMYLMMTAKFNPLGVDGYKMLERIREMTTPLPGNETEPNIVETAVQGDGPSSLDTVHAIYERVPTLAPISVAVGTLIVLIFSRSLTNAARFAVGLSWGMAVTMGSMTLVFQYGWLNWVGVDALSEITGGGEGQIPWIGPIIIFAVSIGLLTCFDILAAKQLQSGRPELLWEVHFAALLSFVAFVGLTVSEVPLMNMVGFSLCICSIMGGWAIPREITKPVFFVLGLKKQC